MGTRLLFLLGAALLCSGACMEVGPPQFGRIEVSAFSILGERFPSPDIDLIEAGTRKSLKDTFRTGGPRTLGQACAIAGGAAGPRLALTNMASFSLGGYTTGLFDALGKSRRP